MEGKNGEKIKVKLIKEFHSNLHIIKGDHKLTIRMAEQFPFLLKLIEYVEKNGTEVKDAYYTTYIIEVESDELLNLMRPKRASKYYEAVKQLIESS